MEKYNLNNKQDLERYIKHYFDKIYIEPQIIKKIELKSNDSLNVAEILCYKLNEQLIKLKLTKLNQDNKINKANKGLINFIQELFSKNNFKSNDLLNILDYIPNQVYRIKNDFKNNMSYGNSLSRLILSKEELNQEILDLINI